MLSPADPATRSPPPGGFAEEPIGGGDGERDGPVDDRARDGDAARQDREEHRKVTLRVPRGTDTGTAGRRETPPPTSAVSSTEPGDSRAPVTAPTR